MPSMPYFLIIRLIKLQNLLILQAVKVFLESIKKVRLTYGKPLSERLDGMYKVTRNLYKNIYGNRVIFEEINHDLELTFKYQWSSSNKFGFVRKATLINNAFTDVKNYITRWDTKILCLMV